MTAFFFPTEFEAKDYLSRLSGRSCKQVEGVPVHTGKMNGAEVLVAIVGIGPELSARSAAAVLKHHRVGHVVVAGFGGALVRPLQRGQVLIIQEYSSEALVNYLRLLPGFDIARLYPSATVIASAAVKQQIGETYGCQVVDMETDAIARVVVQFGAEFLAIRAISDLATEDVPNDVLSQGYDMSRGKTSPFKLLVHLAFHRDRIEAFRKFLQPLPEVRRKLTDFLVAVTKELDGI